MKKNEEMDEILAKTEDFAHYIFTRQDKDRQSCQIYLKKS